jgi:phosphoglycerol transferase MdoB-like AlkP superfamily enzyme
MKFNLKIAPNSCRLILQLGIVWILLSIVRILFYASNKGSFVHVHFQDFLFGAWFDLITIALYFLPFVVLSLLPDSIFPPAIKKRVPQAYYHLTAILLYAVNILDIEYFKYTAKRSTIDLFTVLGAGSDFKQLITTFISDFWLLILLLVILSAIHFFSNRLLRLKFPFEARNTLRKSALNYLLFIPVLIVVGRGGFQLKPAGIIEAAHYTSTENSALILNTGFTMIKSYGQERLDEKNYFSQSAELRLFNPIKTSQPQHKLPDGTNVVFIILESFGIEFIGGYGAKTSFTPFLDSLIDQSLYFQYAYANGKKSIEAVPAIVASIPTLMDNPYISSPYATNKIETLAHILKKKGYSTGFYHGATNGSMRFDSFAAAAGFEKYAGRREYNNDAHFDQTWGILDEHFNPWTAKQLSKEQKPFFATLFTLSSHHPYFIPEHMKEQVKQGPQKICASINYGDIALRKFFEEARKHKWFKNTLFVICADHTPSSQTAHFNQRSMMYRIPILFYHPGGKLEAKKEDRIFQQMDIMPTVLDLLNIETQYYAFGSSYYSDEIPEAIAYLEGTHYYLRDNYQMSFNKDKAKNLYEIRKNEKTPTDSLAFHKQKVYLYENRLKAIIQRYNNDLLNNRTRVQ